MQNSELAREIDAKQLDLRELEFKFKENVKVFLAFNILGKCFYFPI